MPANSDRKGDSMEQKKSKLKICLTLFAAFARMGAFTFGGGYAMLPMLKRECVDHYHWTNEDELLDVYAIGQCTPGVIAVNTATFIGYRTAGTWGAVVATLGIVFPSLVIIMLLAAALSFVMDYPAVQHALNGVRVCVCVLVANAVITLGKKSLTDKFAVVLFIAVLVLAILTDVSAAILVVAAGFVGIATMFVPALNRAQDKKKNDDKEEK